MGYIRHHAIIVTSWREASVLKAHAEAERLFADTAAHVTPISPPAVNAETSFAVLPDGSKEGWGDSDKGDAAREAFKAYLLNMETEGSWCSWVEVNFGGDDGDYAVLETPYGVLIGTLKEPQAIPDRRDSE